MVLSPNAAMVFIQSKSASIVFVVGALLQPRNTLISFSNPDSCLLALLLAILKSLRAFSYSSSIWAVDFLIPSEGATSTTLDWLSDYFLSYAPRTVW